MTRTEKKSRIALILVSGLLTLIGCEILLYIISDTDENIYVVDRRIRLFEFPTKSLEAKIAEFNKQKTS